MSRPADTLFTAVDPASWTPTVRSEEAEMVSMAQQLAATHADGEFRLVFNTGANAGQTVFHVHAHVLGGGLSEASVGA